MEALSRGVAPRVVFGPDGALYGASEANFLYKVNRDGTGFQVLLQFPAVPEGGHQPRTYLLWADDGFFYGTARRGGVGDRGVLFKIKPDGSDYHEFHRFLGSEAGDGADVRSGLVLGVDGALYGVTTGGGNLGGTAPFFALIGTAATIESCTTSGASLQAMVPVRMRVF